MSMPKTVWTFSVDDFTKRVDKEIEARLSPWSDGNRSMRIRFMYRLGWILLCSPTPEKVTALIKDAQSLISINQQQFPGANDAAPGIGESVKLGHGTPRQGTDSPKIDGFMGRKIPNSWTKNWACESGRPI